MLLEMGKSEVTAMASPRWLVFVLPALFLGCMPAQDASNYRTVHAYNKVTGKYFDVSVPYHSQVVFDPASGTSVVQETAPTREETDAAVDKATWNAESAAQMDNYMNGQGGNSTTPSASDSMRSPSDTTTMSGSSYHDPGPFDGDSSGGAPPLPQ
jgi:hypothetical protein